MDDFLYMLIIDTSLFYANQVVFSRTTRELGDNW